MSYILAIDQSTSGTKALLFDGDGAIVRRRDFAHEQKINDRGWVSHDPEEIYRNTIKAARAVVEESGVERSAIVGIAISNQRETALAWDKATGRPLCDAVVWQCGRGQAICDRLADKAEAVQIKTGLPLSPYFSAAKLAWILEQHPAPADAICAGTMDSWLVWKLTGGKVFATDYSNASRTQLFHIGDLAWDEELCRWFGVPVQALPKVRDSNGHFGETDLEGLLPAAVPIHGVMGDSHGALFGQGCHRPGMAKTTYGTGSSIMMNTGSTPIYSKNGLATSLAWGMDGTVDYVLEGNINYTGAVIQWLVEDMKLLGSSKEAGPVAASANQADETCLIPAFTGLGAPYWNAGARAMLWGMSRSTGRAEIVKAAEECIALQIADVVKVMQAEAATEDLTLRLDGGPTKDAYLMQLQSDMLQMETQVSQVEELSATGAAYAAGMALGLYTAQVFGCVTHKTYAPHMDKDRRDAKYANWNRAIAVLNR
ncbi:glycerol kinase GlpK [Ruminococcaceae bacterium OttesenSCG-928-L11]|nr:glycerol kinase GlpK [Ruminococcaceae bacterium OttesenSCG-928-L11]